MAPPRSASTSKDGKDKHDKSKAQRSSSRNKDGKEKKKEAWTCKTCKTEFYEDKAELLECERCEGHVCRLCLNLTVEEYKFLGGRTEFHWYCPSCEEKAVKNIRIDKEIEDRCNEYFKKYENRLKAVEEEVAKKPGVDEVKAMIEESKSDSATGGDSEKNLDLEAINERLEDYKESVSRRNNVVIFNADESEKLEGELRKADDYELVKQICKITTTKPETIKNITRLGRKIEEKPRPIRLIYESESAKNQLMTNLSKLKGAEDKYKKLSFSHDLTKKERQMSKDKWIEAKEKTKALEGSGDEELFKFITKGPPWDKRVVKVKKN